MEGPKATAFELERDFLALLTYNGRRANIAYVGPGSWVLEFPREDGTTAAMFKASVSDPGELNAHVCVFFEPGSLEKVATVTVWPGSSFNVPALVRYTNAQLAASARRQDSETYPSTLQTRLYIPSEYVTHLRWDVERRVYVVDRPKHAPGPADPAVGQ